MDHLTFPHPEPKRTRMAVWPVFLPFAGCPFRCLFCAQDKQTGQDGHDLEAILYRTETELAEALAQGRGPYELAFFGGTFTALPEPWPERFLALARRFRDAGLVTRVRCSTRPDCLDPARLVSFKDQGLSLVELGIQSFDDHALAASGRGYAGDTARRGCALVLQAGLDLGVQLMGGLPGDEPGLFQRDAAETAAIGPEVARLYPCMVVTGTPLARIWERGGFTPWTVDRAVTELAGALEVLWAAKVVVIRMGLAPEPSLAESVLAGPVHPALGQSARGLALFRVIHAQAARLGGSPTKLTVPRKYQGELLGHGRELVPRYRALGLDPARFEFGEGQNFVWSDRDSGNFKVDPGAKKQYLLISARARARHHKHTQGGSRSECLIFIVRRKP